MQGTENQETQYHEAVGPVPHIGSPWSTGLFDCHEDQTIGKFLFCLFPLALGII